MQKSKLIPIVLLSILLTCCRGNETTSASTSLPFACADESASEIYFDASQSQILKGKIDSQKVQNLVVFGDSLSDNGNLGRKTHDKVIPKCTYWNNRFSNGPVWNEYVADGAGWGLLNYAVGGSGTSKELPDSWKGWLGYLNPLNIKDTVQDVILTPFPSQIEQFARDNARGGLDPETTLISIWTGPNRYFVHGEDAENKDGSLNEGGRDRLVQSVIDDIANGVRALRKLGYQRFVIGTMPRLKGLAPDPLGLTKLVSDPTFEAINELHNRLLKELVYQLNDDGAQAILFHSYEVNEDTIANPSHYGFDSFDYCYRGDVLGYFPRGEKGFCKKPLRTKLWDRLHPNTRMHCVYAAQFFRDLQTADWIDNASDILGACLAMRTKSGAE